MEDRKKQFAEDPIQSPWIIKLANFTEVTEELFWEFYNNAFRFEIQRELLWLNPAENASQNWLDTSDKAPQTLNQDVYNEIAEIAHAFVDRYYHPSDQLYSGLYGEKQTHFVEFLESWEGDLDPTVVEQLTALLDRSTERIQELLLNNKQIYETFSHVRKAFIYLFGKIKEIRATDESVEDVNKSVKEKIIPKMKHHYYIFEEVVEEVINEDDGVIELQNGVFDGIESLVKKSLDEKPKMD